jgi:RES domain-containing protein
VIAWRITKRRYSSRDAVLGGIGAEELGGRWNEAGLPLVYASENASLALLETLVQASMQRLPKSLVIVQITIPQELAVRVIAAADLPSSWKAIGNARCVAIGSEWIRSRATPVLRAPSAVNPLEMNVLLNPAHPALAKCRIGRPIPLEFDTRLLSFLHGSAGKHHE